MPAAFDKCIKNGGKVRTKDVGNGKYMHVCFKDGKSYAGEVKKKESLTWVSDFIVEDATPEFLESAGLKTDGKKISGILLRRESRNGRIYELDAMIQASNVAKLPLPISMNHSDNVDDNVGLITNIKVNAEGLDYEGVVFNTAKYPDAIEKMGKHLINKISIEADAGKTEEKDGKIIIKSFELFGAGLVKYAGIPSASASIAEAFENTENFEEVENMELEEKLTASEKELAEAKAKLATIEKMEQERKLAEKEAKEKALEESVATLQSELKALKEKKPSGVITTNDNEDKPVIIEKLERITSKNTFIHEGKGSSNSMFYAVHPSEFY